MANLFQTPIIPGHSIQYIFTTYTFGMYKFNSLIICCRMHKVTRLLLHELSVHDNLVQPPLVKLYECVL